MSIKSLKELIKENRDKIEPQLESILMKNGTEWTRDEINFVADYMKKFKVPKSKIKDKRSEIRQHIGSIQDPAIIEHNKKLKEKYLNDSFKGSNRNKNRTRKKNK